MAISESLLIGLAKTGYKLKSPRRHDDGQMVVRLGTSFATGDSDIGSFLEAIASARSRIS